MYSGQQLLITQLCLSKVFFFQSGVGDNRLIYYAPLGGRGPRPEGDGPACRILELEKEWCAGQPPGRQWRWRSVDGADLSYPSPCRVGYQLVNCVEYHHPIYGLCQLDINRDGVKEVVVCGQFECYLLQPKPTDIKHSVHEILRLMNDLLSLEEELQGFEQRVIGNTI